MSSRPEHRPEGKLISDALRRTQLSARRAAELAGISEGRWRQITSGSQPAGGGQYVRVIAPARTLARMAYVVNVGPEQLSGAGREDAADILRDLLAHERPAGAEAVVAQIVEVLSSSFSDRTKIQMIKEVVQRDAGTHDPQIGHDRLAG